MIEFDHTVDYTDEEFRAFASVAFKTDPELERRLRNFFYGGMNHIDPEKKKRILNGTEPIIVSTPKGADSKYWKKIYDEVTNEDRNAYGTIPIQFKNYQKATEVPLIHDVMGMEAKAREDLFTGPIPINPELVKDSTPYIFNLHHMTKDDHLIISRRAVTCSVARPFTKDLGNGYCEQIWIGDITKWPMYVEYDEEFK